MNMCPHCGWRYDPRRDHLVPQHGCEGHAIRCPGVGQNPRNSESDRRPLWNGKPNLHFNKANCCALCDRQNLPPNRSVCFSCVPEGQTVSESSLAAYRCGLAEAVRVYRSLHSGGCRVLGLDEKCECNCFLCQIQRLAEATPEGVPA